MKTPATKTLPGLALVALTAVLAACGSNTPATVTVTRTVPAPAAPASSSTSSTTSTSASVSSQSSSTTASSATTASSTAASSTTTTETQTTRTETAPAFVGTNPSSGTAIGHDLAAAIAVVEHQGYVPLGTATYDSTNTLRVLIGRHPGTANERAFFFDQTIYLGTDAAAPSQQISLVSANDTEATLSYAIFSPGASAPSGHRDVSFALDMGQLSALNALPSVAERR